MCRSWWSLLSCVLCYNVPELVVCTELCYNVPELVVCTELCAVLQCAGAGGLY